MDWVTGTAVYVVIWWLVVFMVLPWGGQTVGREDVAKGHASSAPRRPRLLLKMAATTVVAAIVWYGIYLIIDSGAISFRE